MTGTPSPNIKGLHLQDKFIKTQQGFKWHKNTTRHYLGSPQDAPFLCVSELL